MDLVETQSAAGTTPHGPAGLAIALQTRPGEATVGSGRRDHFSSESRLRQEDPVNRSIRSPRRAAGPLRSWGTGALTPLQSRVPSSPRQRTTGVAPVRPPRDSGTRSPSSSAGSECPQSLKTKTPPRRVPGRGLGWEIRSVGPYQVFTSSPPPILLSAP
jgi:hypothetical protein